MKDRYCLNSCDGEMVLTYHFAIPSLSQNPGWTKTPAEAIEVLRQWREDLDVQEREIELGSNSQ